MGNIKGVELVAVSTPFCKCALLPLWENIGTFQRGHSPNGKFWFNLH